MDGNNLSGQTLGQYELNEMLGRGGMGAVYRAYQRTLDRHVAVKVMSLAISQEPGYAERFNREAKMAASLEHPHIVPVYDYGISGDISYVVMRLLTGKSLEQRMRDGALSLAEIAVILKQVASALDYAHSQNLIHRDIKPSNVMFDSRGAAYIVDFGIAKLLQSGQSLTGRSMMLGTPSYMSPEQWQDEAITSASDQYALAVMTYQLITGELPFEATTPYALMNKHLNLAPKPPQVIRPEIPVSVSLVVQRALSKSPTDRFASVGAFAAAFEMATLDTEANLATTPLHVQLPAAETRPKVIEAPAPATATQRLPRPQPNRQDRTRRGAAVITVLVLVGLGALLLRVVTSGVSTGTPTEIAASGDLLGAVTEEATVEATAKVPTDTPPASTAAPRATASDSPTSLTFTHTPTPVIQYVYIEATQCLTPSAVLTEDPDAEPTLTVSQNFRQGQQSMGEGDYQQAVTSFNAAITVDPMYVDAYYYRGYSYQQLEDEENALADYNRVITLDPSNQSAYIARAEVKTVDRDYTGALEDVNTALELSGGGGDAYIRYMRGLIYMKLGDYEEAVADFTRALQLSPDETYIYADRAWSYFELANYQAAIRDFTAFLEYDPSSLETYHGKGDAQVNIGDFEGAVETFTAALALDQDNTATLQRLGDALYELERWSEALEHYNHYVELARGMSEEYILERITELEDATQEP